MKKNTLTLNFCDAHVHVYNCFDIDEFLDSAWKNFSRQSDMQENPGSFNGVLFFSEAKQDRCFSKLKQNDYRPTNWKVRETAESDSLCLVDELGNRLFIINGRQIVTAENLEVLALATAECLEDGRPIDEVINWAITNRAIPVIPWGFGKWWGRRGRFLSEMLEVFAADVLFLGDNSGRVSFLGEPDHFKRAISERRRILPGSDPLPFASEAWRPGSVGFYFEGAINENTPAENLRNYLFDPQTITTSYMHCERLLPFVRNQVAMQLKKRM